MTTNDKAEETLWGAKLTRRHLLLGGAAAGAAYATGLSGFGLSGRVAAAGPNIYVRDFGAIPDNGTDDTDAIRAAFDEAKLNAGSTVIFETGTYHVEGKEAGWAYEPSASNPLVEFHGPIFTLDGHQDLTIAGQGATLQGRKWASMFHISNVDGLLMSNINFDWARDLPMTDGYIEDIREQNGSYFVDVRVRPGFTIRPGLFAQGFIPYNLTRERHEPPFLWQRSDDRLPLPCTPNPNDPGLLTCGLDPNLWRPNLAAQLVGSGVTVVHANTTGPGLVIAACQDIQLHQVRIRTAPGQGLLAGNIHNFEMNQMRIAPHYSVNPEKRWMSTIRGATNTAHISGIAALRSSVIERSADDAFNFRGLYFTGQVQGNRTLVIDIDAYAHGWGLLEDGFQYAPLEAGDTVEVSAANEDVLEPVATLGLSAVSKVRSASNPGRAIFTLTFASDLPAQLIADGTAAVLNVSRMPTKVEVYNNTISKILGGGRINAHHADVWQNTFSQTISCPVAFDPGWGYPTSVAWEAQPAKHVVIRANTFDDVNFTKRGPGHEGMIAMKAYSTPQAAIDAGPGTFTDIEIKNNTFAKVSQYANDAYPLMGIYMESASDVTISGNTFTGWESIPNRRVVADSATCDCQTILFNGSSAC